MIFLQDLKKYSIEQFLIYLRKSRSDNPDESVEEVLARHEKELQEWSIRTFELPIPENNIYREVVSGETIKDRPKIQKVLRIIEDENIKGVIVIEPQRLSRGDWEDGGKILNSFKYSNTMICTPHKIYDLQDEYDYKGFKNELSAGHDFLQYMKGIMDRGLQCSAKEGQYISSKSPFGYKKVTIIKNNKKKKTLEIIESEAEIVRMMYKWRVDEHLGLAKIAMRLDELGIKTKGGNPWHPKTIRNILTNNVYIGKISWKETTVEKILKDGEIVKVRVKNTNEETHIHNVDGMHEAIIDEELFYASVNSFNQAPIKKMGDMRNPLSSLIKCKKCGYAMIYSLNKKYPSKQPRLKCSSKKCTTASSTFDDVYFPIIEFLKSKISEFELRVETDNNDQEIRIYEEMIENKKKELDKLEQRQDELYDLLEEGIYSKEVFINRNKKLEKEREELQETLKKLKKEKPIKINYQELVYKYKDVVNALLDETISAKDKNIMLRSIVEKILYSREREEGTSKFNKYTASKPDLEIFLKQQEG